MRTIIIDLACIETVRALHIYLAYRLGLPAYYGANLDALHDVLTEIAECTHIVLLAQGVTGENTAYLPKLVRVLEDAQAENCHLTVELMQ